MTPAAGASEPEAPAPRARAASGMAAPKKIGRYEVERLLGQGGMGRVWLARDTVLGRKVAIKILRDDLALPPPVRDELVLRMRHEARAAAAVSHPNIVTLHDMGEDDLVGLFLVFEYVTTKDAEAEGSPAVVLSLRDRLRRGPLAFSEVAKLARELGSALSFAHEAGVIHRDVKPENVLFSRTGAKIADFGIARIPESTITRANTVLGTPAYTAPEALSKGDFGPTSDQFSLAATLYEAAAGARAFGGEDAIATAGKVSNEAPSPLHESLGAEPTVKALEAALRRGLAKSPDERFSSCAELGEAIARAVDDEDGPRRAAASARAGAQLAAVAGLIEFERTPLSSRIALVERAINEHAGAPGTGAAETPPRPSILLRKRTHRFQNVAAGLALLVIVALFLFGRRTPSSGESAPAPSESESASAPSAPAPLPRVAPRPRSTPAPRSTEAPASATTTDRDADGGDAEGAREPEVDASP